MKKINILNFIFITIFVVLLIISIFLKKYGIIIGWLIGMIISLLFRFLSLKFQKIKNINKISKFVVFLILFRFFLIFGSLFFCSFMQFFFKNTFFDWSFLTCALALILNNYSLIFFKKQDSNE